MIFKYLSRFLKDRVHITERELEIVERDISNYHYRLEQKMSYKYSEKSLKRIEKCHPWLQLILHKLIEVEDITIIDSLRDEKTQNNYYNAGKSQVKYPDSKHNKSSLLKRNDLSDAVDIAIWHKDKPNIRWDDPKDWYYLGGLVLGMAHQLGIKMRWGGHFSSFFDGGHFELVDN